MPNEIKKIQPRLDGSLTDLYFTGKQADSQSQEALTTTDYKTSLIVEKINYLFYLQIFQSSMKSKTKIYDLQELWFCTSHILSLPLLCMVILWVILY